MFFKMSFNVFHYAHLRSSGNEGGSLSQSGDEGGRRSASPTDPVETLNAFTRKRSAFRNKPSSQVCAHKHKHAHARFLRH